MKKVVYTMLALVAVTLAGCGSNQKTASSSSETTSSSTATSITVKDSNGAEVKVPTNPEKVVVFDNGSLDTMDALGVGDAVIGAPTENLPASQLLTVMWKMLGASKNQTWKKSINCNRT